MGAKLTKKRQYWLAGNRDAAQDEFFVAALDKNVWIPGDPENWDTCWYTGMPDPEVFEQLTPSKTANHIPGNNGLTIKDYLYETLSSARTRLLGTPRQSRMDYFPRVYAMPDEYHELQQKAFENPAKKWILKPKNSSRGRGIEVVQDIADIPLEEKWMVQEYIDNPHTMNGHKYVLRLYVLVTSVEPLRVYLHREGFAKLASEPYNIEDPDNPFAHLTNPDINATNIDADAPVVFKSLSVYRQWLRDAGHDDAALFAKIQDLVTLTIISVRERMRKRTHEVNAPTDGCYELLGLDCLVDDQLKPWILECNLSPSLEVCAKPEDGGDTEKAIKSGMISDMISLLGLNHPPVNYEGLSPKDVVRQIAEQELARAGDFQRLFPAKETVDDYLSFFPVPRYSDMVSASQILGQAPAPVKLVPAETIEIVSEDELALYSEKTGTLFMPNQLAGWIWLKVADGASPQDIADELIARHTTAHGSPDEREQWMMRENVWDVLASWAQIGLLRNDDPDYAVPIKTNTGQDDIKQATSDTLQIGGRSIALHYGSATLASRLGSLFLAQKTTRNADMSITIQCADIGYALAVGPLLVAMGIGLDRIAQVLSRALFEQAATRPDEIAIAGTLVPVSNDEADFFVAAQESQWESCLPLLYSQQIGQSCYGGMLLNLQNGQTFAIGLPLQVNEEDIPLVEKKLDGSLPLHTQNWATGGQGRLLASSSAQSGHPYKIRNIFLTNRATNSSQKVTTNPSSVHKALGAILASARPSAATNPSGEQVEQLNDWLEECAIIKVDFSTPDRAAKKLVTS